MKQKNNLFISVIGESKASKKNYKIAEKVGELLAKAGAVVFCGGRKAGVMDAVCKGAKKGGGLTVGILPGSKREDASDYVDIPVPTGIGYARNKIVVKCGKSVIAIGGSYGTLCEMAYALGYKIPVFGINTWKIDRTGHPKAPVRYCKTAEEAVKLAVAAAQNA